MTSQKNDDYYDAYVDYNPEGEDETYQADGTETRDDQGTYADYNTNTQSLAYGRDRTNDDASSKVSFRKPQEFSTGSKFTTGESSEHRFAAVFDGYRDNVDNYPASRPTYSSRTSYERGGTMGQYTSEGNYGSDEVIEIIDYPGDESLTEVKHELMLDESYEKLKSSEEVYDTNYNADNREEDDFVGSRQSRREMSSQQDNSSRVDSNRSSDYRNTSRESINREYSENPYSSRDNMSMSKRATESAMYSSSVNPRSRQGSMEVSAGEITHSNLNSLRSRGSRSSRIDDTSSRAELARKVGEVARALNFISDDDGSSVIPGRRIVDFYGKLTRGDDEYFDTDSSAQVGLLRRFDGNPRNGVNLMNPADPRLNPELMYTESSEDYQPYADNKRSVESKVITGSKAGSSFAYRSNASSSGASAAGSNSSSVKTASVKGSTVSFGRSDVRGSNASSLSFSSTARLTPSPRSPGRVARYHPLVPARFKQRQSITSSIQDDKETKSSANTASVSSSHTKSDTREVTSSHASNNGSSVATQNAPQFGLAQERNSFDIHSDTMYGHQNQAIPSSGIDPSRVVQDKMHKGIDSGVENQPNRVEGAFRSDVRSETVPVSTTERWGYHEADQNLAQAMNSQPMMKSAGGEQERFDHPPDGSSEGTEVSYASKQARNARGKKSAFPKSINYDDPSFQHSSLARNVSNLMVGGESTPTMIKELRAEPPPPKSRSPGYSMTAGGYGKSNLSSKYQRSVSESDLLRDSYNLQNRWYDHQNLTVRDPYWKNSRSGVIDYRYFMDSARVNPEFFYDANGEFHRNSSDIQPMSIISQHIPGMQTPLDQRKIREKHMNVSDEAADPVQYGGIRQSYNGNSMGGFNGRDSQGVKLAADAGYDANPLSNSQQYRASPPPRGQSRATMHTASAAYDERSENLRYDGIKNSQVRVNEAAGVWVDKDGLIAKSGQNLDTDYNLEFNGGNYSMYTYPVRAGYRSPPRANSKTKGPGLYGFVERNLPGGRMAEGAHLFEEVNKLRGQDAIKQMNEILQTCQMQGGPHVKENCSATLRNSADGRYMASHMNTLHASDPLPYEMDMDFAPRIDDASRKSSAQTLSRRNSNAGGSLPGSFSQISDQTPVRQKELDPPSDMNTSETSTGLYGGSSAFCNGNSRKSPTNTARIYGGRRISSPSRAKGKTSAGKASNQAKRGANNPQDLFTQDRGRNDISDSLFVVPGARH